MISMDVFFKQMRKWVSQGGDRPVFQNIYCDGERAVATDTHSLVIVKDWKATPGFMDTDGRPVLAKYQFPDFSGVTAPMEKWDWRLMLSESIMKRLKDFCAYAEKLNRGKGRQSGPTYLGIRKAGEQVSIYCMNDDLRIRVEFWAKANEDEAVAKVFPEDKTGTAEQYVDASRLKLALEFLLVAGMRTVTIGGKGGKLGITHFESAELYMTICGVSFKNAKPGAQTDLPMYLEQDHKGNAAEIDEDSDESAFAI